MYRRDAIKTLGALALAPVVGWKSPTGDKLIEPNIYYHHYLGMDYVWLSRKDVVEICGTDKDTCIMRYCFYKYKDREYCVHLTKSPITAKQQKEQIQNLANEGYTVIKHQAHLIFEDLEGLFIAARKPRSTK